MTRQSLLAGNLGEEAKEALRAHHITTALCKLQVTRLTIDLKEVRLKQMQSTSRFLVEVKELIFLLLMVLASLLWEYVSAIV